MIDYNKVNMDNQLKALEISTNIAIYLSDDRALEVLKEKLDDALYFIATSRNPKGEE